MRLLCKTAMLGVAACAATVTLIGSGVGASFTDTSTIGTSMATGNVTLAVTPGEGVLSPAYSDSGPLQPWSTSDDPTSTVSPSANFSAEGGFGLTPPQVLGAHFKGFVLFTVRNTGSLDVDSLSLTVSDPGNIDSALESDTEVSVFAFNLSALPASLEHAKSPRSAYGTLASRDAVWSGPLGTLTSSNPPNPVGTLGHLPAHQADLFIVTLTPKKGKYSNQDEKGVMALRFQVTGSDV